MGDPVEIDHWRYQLKEVPHERADDERNERIDEERSKILANSHGLTNGEWADLAERYNVDFEDFIRTCDDEGVFEYFVMQKNCEYRNAVNALLDLFDYKELEQ